MYHKVEATKDNPNSAYFGCTLKNTHISTSAAIVKHEAFLRGVMKIQRNQMSTMTQSEQDACSMMKIDATEEIVDKQGLSSEEDNVMKDIAKDNEKSSNAPRSYMNANFLLSSVAEVQRLWSRAKSAFPSHRKSCTPMITEALLFLKVNSSYWNQDLVCEAIEQRRSDEVEAQMAADAIQTALAKPEL